MLYILQILIRWRKFIILSALGSAAVMAGVSFLLPSWYRAHTSIFPPETSSGIPPMYADLVAGLQLPSFGGLSAIGARPETIYIDVMRSRRVGKQLLDEFDMYTAYGTNLTFEAHAALDKHTSFALLENGLLNISFEDRDPERAAAICNRYVELLDEFNRQSNITKASRSREFIEGQLETQSAEMAAAEQALADFQGENQALDLDEQVRATIEMVAELTADVIALEVEIEILSQYTSATSQEFVRKKKEYDEKMDQLKKLKIQSARSEDDFMRSFFPAFDRVPQVALEFARLTRAVMIEQKVYELLVTEYERSRIEEARDTPTVQVLDVATVPERRHRPKRKILVVAGGVAGLGWSMLVALLMGFWREDREKGDALKGLVGPIASDVRRVFRRN